MTAVSVEKKVNGHTVASHAEPGFDAVALAEAEAIRKHAEAERIKAESEKALKIEQTKQLHLENEKQQLANERAALRFKREEAEQLAKIEEAERKREETARAREAAQRAAEEAQKAEQAKANEVAQADSRWRSYALTFYVVCAIVALPVQVAAFWSPRAPWLIAAPLMLEGGAWVVLKGAAAAVASHRPHWHYRLIAWLLAFIAAGINLWHGLAAFDPATAIGTAFASVAGPGVWDLHEHGRIRKRDGALTRRERRDARKEAKRLAAEQAAKERRETERQAYKEKAAREAAAALDEARKSEFPDVHRHALKLAADLGETAITEAIWKRAKLDVHGALPGESAEVFRMRNAAEARVEAARQKKPVSTVSKTTNAQRANQMPRAQRGPARKPPVRHTGDTQKYVAAARRQASITAKNARPNVD